MSKNPKNQLQEFLVKITKEYPKYETKRVGGQDHDPRWQSTVFFGSQSLTGSVETNKRKAEEAVSKKWFDVYSNKYQEIKEDPKQESVFFPSTLPDDIKNMDHIIIADLENRPDVVNFTTNINTILVGVVGHCHNLSAKHLPGVVKCVIKSSVKDAADHALSFITGMLATHFTTEQKVYIVSKDHFAQVVVECLNSLPNHLKVEHKPFLTQEEVFSFPFSE